MSWFWKTTLYMNGMKSRTFFLFFCRATSLQINWSKSSFHYSNLFDQTLFQLHLLFPHTFTNMSESFNYFGYFMKANSCRIVDWNWLLEKVKKWIGNWCNRWLSLDGRYTLLKSSMEGRFTGWHWQPSFWPCSTNSASSPSTSSGRVVQPFHDFISVAEILLQSQNIKVVGVLGTFSSSIWGWQQTHSGVCLQPHRSDILSSWTNISLLQQLLGLDRLLPSPFRLLHLEKLSADGPNHISLDLLESEDWPLNTPCSGSDSELGRLYNFFDSAPYFSPLSAYLFSLPGYRFERHKFHHPLLAL